MKLLLVLSLSLLALASAYQETPWLSSCPCGRIYVPLCGSDGLTYNNRCEFDCRASQLRKILGVDNNIFVKKTGRCEDDVVL
ncbi:protease inhibitor 2-like isoform X2 [Choristoneura fumiferana]|uniref:protease inhibitor 2-like isoform X2 n=1 Tax=Choristoneura fumiferana TaxID=7141 RepID=UPI003D1584FD